MKLFNHRDEVNNNQNNLDIDRQLQLTSEELKIYEDRFYKVFNLNPCPMSISEVSNNIIVDVNQSFLEVIECRRDQIIGYSTVEKNIISNKNRTNILKIIMEKGFLKNYCCEFRTLQGKKRTGMFSGTLIDISNKTCLMLICQVVNKKFLTGIFKTFLSF